MFKVYQYEIILEPKYKEQIIAIFNVEEILINGRTDEIFLQHDKEGYQYTVLPIKELGIHYRIEEA